MSFPPGPDPYAILGVKPSATVEEIDKAYRMLQRIHHPDRGGSAEVSARINHAHDILSDPVKRVEYDRERFGPRPTTQSASREAPGFRPPPPSPSYPSSPPSDPTSARRPPRTAVPGRRQPWHIEAWGVLRHPRTPLTARQVRLVRLAKAVLASLIVVGIILVGATADGVA